MLFFHVYELKPSVVKLFASSCYLSKSRIE